MAKPVRLVFLADDNQLRSALSRLVAGTTAVQAKLAALQKTGADMQRIGRTMALGITAPVLAAATASAYLGAQFEATMTKVQTLAGASAEQIKGWSAQILQLSPAIAKSPQELADALYFIVSSGAKASDAMSILTASAKASSAGLGDTKIIADAVTSAMNAYGSQNLSAARATDILVRAVKDGKGEASALAQSIGLVVPIAAQLGVGFDQVAGAMAALTQTGSSTAEASTQLRNIFTELLHPSSAVSKELTQMGLSSEYLQNELKSKGLLATLTDLKGRVGGNEEAFSRLFPNVRGLLGALSLVGPNGQKAADVLRDVAAAGGDVNSAFDVTKKTRMFEFRDALAALQVIGIKIGDDLAPAIGKLTGFLTGLLDKFDRMKPSTRSLIEGLLGVAAAMGPLLYVSGSMLKTFSSLAKHPIIAMVVLLAFAFVTAYMHSQKFRDAVDNVAKALGDAAKWIDKNKTLLLALTGGLTTFLTVARGATLISNTAKFMQLFGVSMGTAFRAIMPLGGLFSKFVGGLRAAWLALNTTFLASPIGIIIALILALAVVIYIAWTRSSTFRKIVEETWKAITKAVGTAVKAIGKFFAEIWSFLQSHWKLIVSIVGGPVAALAVLIGTHMKQITAFFTAAWRDILGVLKPIGSAFVTLGKAIASVLMSIGRAILAFVLPPFQALAAGVTWAAKVIWAIISGLFRLIMAFVLPTLRILKIGWDELWKLFVVGVQVFVSLVKPWIASLVAFVTTNWDMMTSLVVRVTTALWNFLVNIWTAVRNFLVGNWNGIVATLKAVWDLAYNIVVAKVQTLYGQIKVWFDLAKSYIVNLWNSVTSFLGGLWDGIVGKVKNGAQRVYDGLMSIWGKISGAVSGAFSGVTGAVRGAINDVIRIVNGIHIPAVKVAGVQVFDGWSGFNIPMLAKGGIVNSPTLAMIGEAGPELVLPLSRKQRAMELLEQSGLLGPSQRSSRPSAVSGPSAPSGGKTVNVNIGTINTQAQDVTGISKEITWQARVAAI